MEAVETIRLGRFLKRNKIRNEVFAVNRQICTYFLRTAGFFPGLKSKITQSLHPDIERAVFYVPGYDLADPDDHHRNDHHLQIYSRQTNSSW